MPAGMRDQLDAVSIGGSRNSCAYSGAGGWRSVQPSLDFTAPPERIPRKRVRQTSREAYRRQRAIDEQKRDAGHETREGQVLRVLAWHWNATLTHPTARELLHWAEAHGERFDDINSVRPRLSEMCELGLVTTAGKRKCTVSKNTASVWRVPERQ